MTEDEDDRLREHIIRLEAENGRLALKIQRMEHEAEERVLKRVFETVEQQERVDAQIADITDAHLSQALTTLRQYIGPLADCRVTRQEAEQALAVLIQRVFHVS